MSTASFLPVSFQQFAEDHRLPGVVLDSITDALLTSDDPVARAETVCRLVDEMVQSVAWLGDRLAEGELNSLHTVLDAATRHHRWLAEHAASQLRPFTGLAS